MTDEHTPETDDTNPLDVETTEGQAAEAPAPDAETTESIAPVDDDSGDDTPDEDTDEDTDDGSKASREAKKYRLRAKAAEEQVTALTEQVDTLRRHIAEAATPLASPAALWATGTTVGDLFTEDGQLDPDALSQAVQRAKDELGAATKPRAPKPDMNQGREPVGRWAGPTIADVIQGRK